jgi:NAD(P)-dependent dehydrogenase (short-subunit alcohol dehydrogenase family)
MSIQDPFSLEGKKIIITGASSGIGRATAVECSRAGATLLLLARNLEQLEKTYQSLVPGNHRFVSTDLNHFDETESVISTFSESNGNIDGFVHAAGIEMTVPLQMIKPEHFEKLFSINVIAGFNLARIVAKKKFMDPGKGASFVFISSIRALYGQEGAIAYSASKGALSSGMKAMAVELAPKKIRVNAILPAIVKTEMTDSLFASVPDEVKQKMEAAHPLGFGQPQDVAFASVYLLSDAGKWMTGNNLVLDGGYSAR